MRIYFLQSMIMKGVSYLVLFLSYNPEHHSNQNKQKIKMALKELCLWKKMFH